MKLTTVDTPSRSIGGADLLGNNMLTHNHLCCWSIADVECVVQCGSQWADLQELGPKYARNVKVSMDEMRRKQFAAAKIVMRHQHHFLRDGSTPIPSSAESKLAPVGDVNLGLDDEGLKVCELLGVPG